VSEASLCGTGSNLVDMGRFVARERFVRNSAHPLRSQRGRLSAGNVCGVPAEATGAKLGTSLVDRNQVNVGTIPGSPFPRRDPVSRRVGVIAHRQVRGGAEPS
jgi:hypothetical protein